ncbi:MAG TPA: SDR family oxidoreductase [Caulobacteraceae bacterium]|nr:SDR family oxidoreductase [Caulobacteraceae bacterium]
MAERTALIVGASRGLGLGLAEELVKRGWGVIGTVRSEASSARLQALADKSSGKVRIETLDVDDVDQIAALAKRLSGETLDLLFVVAGVTHGRSKPTEASREQIARIFVTNTVAPLRVAEALVDRVRDGTGVIAMMSSTLGSISVLLRAGDDLYSASKAALNMLTRCFAEDLGDRKLTVLTMSPGWVRTDMGGPDAPLSIEESVTGMVDVVERMAGTRAHGFYGYDGAMIGW